MRNCRRNEKIRVAPEAAHTFQQANMKTSNFVGPSSNIAGMESLEAAARNLAMSVADEYGLGVSFEVHDHFAASVNDSDAYHVATKAMEAIGVPHGQESVPMRASEDFGVFGWGAKAAMLCLGPGEDHAALHNPDYDFPDDLIPIGSAILERIARDLLGTA